VLPLVLLLLVLLLPVLLLLLLLLLVLLLLVVLPLVVVLVFQLLSPLEFVPLLCAPLLECLLNLDLICCRVVTVRHLGILILCWFKPAIWLAIFSPLYDLSLVPQASLTVLILHRQALCVSSQARFMKRLQEERGCKKT